MTLSHWNPSTPNRAGLEYEADLASGSVGTKQLTVVQGWLQRMRSETAETVDGVVVGRSIAAPPSSSDVDYSAWLLEVLTDGSEAAAFGAGTDYLPNASAIGTMWEQRYGIASSGSLDVSPESAWMTDITFSADGTKCYISSSSTDTVFQYGLTTAWDISTATYATKSLSVSAQDTSPEGIAFSADGTKCYVAGFANSTVFQYGLTTAWDISTATYATKSLSVLAQDTSPGGVVFSADGTKAYVMGSNSRKVFQYGLTTAWDISTATYATISLFFPEFSTFVFGIALSADGTSVYLPGYSAQTAYQLPLGAAWDLSSAASESVNNVDTATFVMPVGANVASDTIEFSFATGAATFAAKRIKLQVKISVNSPVVGGTQPHVLFDVGFTTDSGVNSCLFGQLDAAGDYTLDLPEINPFTKLAWTQADVQAFDSTSRITLTVNGTIGSGLWSDRAIYSMSLNVTTVPENRQAIAVGMDSTAASNSQKALTLTQDDVVTAWTKAVNTTYSVVVRALSLGAATLGYIYVDDGTTQERWYSTGPTVPYLTGPTDPGWTGYLTNVVAVDADGLVVATGTTAWAAVAAGAMAQIIWLAGATERTDSQPYSAVRDDPVSTGVGLYQEFLAPASASFDGIEFVGYVPAGQPTSDLTVEVQRIFDSTVFGTATVTVAAINGSPLIGGSSWRKVTVALGSVVALVSGTAYKIVFTSATPDTLPYRIQGLDVQQDLTSTGYGTSGFGGVGSNAVIGGVARDEADVVAWVYDGPTPPAALAGVGGAVTSAWTGVIGLDPVDCPPTAVPYVALTWTATVLGGVFVEYDLQRRDDIDTAWQTIAAITVEATASFDDYEARMSVGVDYRIRAVSSYGAGAWSTITGVVIEASAAMLTFTTNVDRTQVVAVLDTYRRDTTIGYKFPEAGRVLSYPVHGRDTPVVFKPVERSGAIFDRDVIADVFDLSTAPPAGPDAVAPLRDLAADADISLVCIRDAIGNRWFGNISVPTVAAVILDDRVALMTATVRIVESSTIPTSAAT